MSKVKAIKKELDLLANKKQAEISRRFFKTGKGEYGEGDIFLGIKVPVQRKVALKFENLPLKDIERLLRSEIHEYRFTAAIILVNQFKKAKEKLKEKIYKLYLKNTNWINNWDLVDVSAHYIVGEYLLGNSRDVLYKLAKSKTLWDRRIAIISTFAFIRDNDFRDTIRLVEIFLNDKHDLMHKACGWMLREVGKKSEQGEKELVRFLDKYILKMPRTTLRYAIERLPETKRKYYLGLGKK
ncbi:DNA alkylation repair protein [Candidatus Parcubacteria bacterium]|nr:DNA alkylation repair protein [Candidatus Parcubacteria bacterium]